MALDPQRLARVHRVRTLQLGLARADEARALDQVASETRLSQRIAQLAQAVEPAPASGGALDGAAGLAAAAHFRERLQRSAEAAVRRVREAEVAAERRGDATRAAKREQTAVEKLIERGQAELARAALKALEELPATGRTAGRSVGQDS